jgi:hypothetical protein
VRGRDGELIVGSGPKPRLALGPLGRVPVVRGVLRLGEGLAVVPLARGRVPQARLAMEDRTIGLAMLASSLAGHLARRRVRSPGAQELVSSVIGLAPALLALRSSEASVWHGVEHKSIAAYERGGPAGVAGAGDEPKEHDRCGSNLVLPMAVTSLLGHLVARRMWRGRRPRTARALAGTVAVGAAVEVFAFAGRNPRHPLSRVVHGAGHAIQAGFATREPGAEELAVGRAAMHELLRLEGVGGAESARA